MQYEFHAEARVEFLEVVSRYENEVPGLGARFIAEIERCIELLLDSPLIGKPYGGELRCFPLNDAFPFSLVYAAKGELLFIVAVAHQSRRPRYWKSRV